jgi:hypothetical protein
MNDNIDAHEEKGFSIPGEKSPDIPKKSPKERFIEKWNSKDETCPSCNHITKINRGITKQNMKRLVWGPPNIQDWLTLVMLIGILLMAYRYNIETAQARDVINNIDSICLKYNIAEADVLAKNNELKEKWGNQSLDWLILNGTTSAAT